MFDDSDPVEPLIVQQIATFSAGFSEIDQTFIVNIIQYYLWYQRKPPHKAVHA